MSSPAWLPYGESDTDGPASPPFGVGVPEQQPSHDHPSASSPSPGGLMMVTHNKQPSSSPWTLPVKVAVALGFLGNVLAIVAIALVVSSSGTDDSLDTSVAANTASTQLLAIPNLVARHWNIFWYDRSPSGYALPDGSVLGSPRDQKNTIALYSLATGEQLRTVLTFAGAGEVYGVVISSPQGELFSINNDYDTYIYSVQSGARAAPLFRSLIALAFTHSANRVVLVARDYTAASVWYFERDVQAKVADLESPSGSVSGEFYADYVVVDPSDTSVAYSGTEDENGRIRIYELATGKLLRHLSLGADFEESCSDDSCYCGSVAWSPDGGRLYALCFVEYDQGEAGFPDDLYLAIWDMTATTNNATYTITVPTLSTSEAFAELSLSSDGQLCAIAAPGLLHVYKVATAPNTPVMPILLHSVTVGQGSYEAPPPVYFDQQDPSRLTVVESLQSRISTFEFP